VRRAARSRLRLHDLRALRVGTVRLAPRQLPLFEGTGEPAGWKLLDERARGTKFVELPVRRILNSSVATGMGFWSVNPYVGCEFGCAYCYARDTHRYTVERAHDQGQLSEEAFREFRGEEGWEAFERRIFVKSGAADVLVRTLDPARLAGASIVIGTATDPYQPAERRFRLTRAILEALGRHRGLSIGIITKSPLVVRDIDLLAELGGRHRVSVHMSIATIDAALARRLEPRSPVPAARIRALARLAAAGVRTGILIAPIIPGVTDGRAALSGLIAAARSAGASYAVGSPLRLGPAARRRFLPYLEREFPELAPRYRRHYAGADHVTRGYHDALDRRLEELQREHGFDVEEGLREAEEWRDGPVAATEQQEMFTPPRRARSSRTSRPAP